MKLMPCPLHGARNISEFVCKGPVQEMPSMKCGESSRAQDASRLAWSNYLFMSTNTAGVVDEWWLHTPSGLWFVARRDTRTDQILQTWLMRDYARLGKTKTSRKS